ncbi:MAG: hypothetical protein ACI8RZ_005954, partial [Myxococcota bacterium]
RRCARSASREKRRGRERFQSRSSNMGAALSHVGGIYRYSCKPS